MKITLLLLFISSLALGQRIKFSVLDPATTLGGTEIVPGVQSGGNVKISINQINTFISSLYWKTNGNTLVTEDIIIDGSSAGKDIEMYFDSFVMSTATSGFGFDAAGADFTGDTGYVRLRSENGANDVLIETTPTNLTLDTDDDMTWRVIDNLVINTVTPTTGLFIGNTNGTPAWAPISIPSTIPSSPVTGDIWIDGTDIKIRIGATTYTLTKTP